ncbi:MAG: trypsin-like peptidase domain-containing protein [Clostridia bacterium]|nr:trypsin-like peptidase domain-containing protein [Clostridia bacterium]
MYSYKTKESKLKKYIILIILMIVVSAASIFIYDMYLNIEVKSYDISDENTAVRLSNNKNEDTTNTIEQVVKCVVGISKIQDVGTSIFLKDSTTSLGLGTGIIVSENGYILTNWHVAGEKYNTCYVTLDNSNEYNGTVVWADKDLDLAIIKINASRLNYLEFADSENIKLGQKVYAIGNPVGMEFQRTVTAGIISGLNRTVKIEEEDNLSYMEDLIQTDASINSGNSGGPLVNEEGKVIGINSVKIDTAEGIGFAIPINIIKPVVESYAKTDSFEEAYLGIFAYDKEVIPYLDSQIEFESGIYVAEISKDGPCYNTGLKEGDIITSIDGFEINRMGELRNYIYTKKVGEETNLTVLRNSKEYNLKVKLGKKL